MTRRIYIGSDRVTVSKPGYDAVSPPAVDYKYLALDSRLPIGRPLEVGLIPNASFGAPISFTTVYPFVPGVEIMAFSPQGTAMVYANSIVMRDSNGTTAYNRTSWYLAIWRDHFQVIDDAVYQQSFMFSSVYSGFYYIVWQTW